MPGPQWNDVSTEASVLAYVIEYETIVAHPTDLIGIDPRLAPLDDYGGPTQTHALEFDSPAIDAGLSPVHAVLPAAAFRRRYRSGAPLDCRRGLAGQRHRGGAR